MSIAELTTPKLLALYREKFFALVEKNHANGVKMICAGAAIWATGLEDEMNRRRLFVFQAPDYKMPPGQDIREQGRKYLSRLKRQARVAAAAK